VAWVYVLPFALYGLVLAMALPSARGGLARLEDLIVVSTASARVVPLLLVVAVLLAYRRTRDRQMRQRMRWVVVSLVAALTFYVVVGQVPDVVLGHPLLGWGVIQLGFIICPLAIAAAILRYRLFDIELIFKRSLVYAGLTLGLVTVYLAALAGLTQWFPSRSPVIALAAGSLVALCFHPLRARLRRWVSRLVYGARDDPYEVVSQLSELDDNASAPRAALTRAVETLAQTLRLSYVAIELRHGGGRYETSAGSGRSGGSPTQVPLIHAGDTVGHLLLDVMPGREPFGPADRRLLDDVARQVSRLAGVVLLNSALQRSRARLVSAREEERRRLHRDLHDGIGPTLAAQAMQLDVVRTVLHTDPAAAEQTLNGLAAGTQSVLGEIRRIVDDLRPRALDQLGLVWAIREKSTTFARPHGAGSGLQIDIDAGDASARLPAAVEVAAYRITLEALTNAARHGGARHCRVILREDHGVLLVQVHDDGTGLPAYHVPGVGLRSMRERAAELGGSFTAQADPGGGTLITAYLPLPDPDETQP
jgi:two-component system NarL family sensor kinase